MDKQEPSNTDEGQAEQTIVVRLAQVNITRGLEVIVREVMEHEVPLLEKVHGEDMVQIVDGFEGDVEISADADAEYARLVQIYNTRGVDVVESVYRSPRELRGFERKRGGEKAAASEQIVRRPASKLAKKAAKVK
jgi:hypothetical protein